MEETTNNQQGSQIELSFKYAPGSKVFLPSIGRHVFISGVVLRTHGVQYFIILDGEEKLVYDFQLM